MLISLMKSLVQLMEGVYYFLFTSKIRLLLPRWNIILWLLQLSHHPTWLTKLTSTTSQLPYTNFSLFLVSLWKVTPFLSLLLSEENHQDICQTQSSISWSLKNLLLFLYHYQLRHNHIDKYFQQHQYYTHLKFLQWACTSKLKKN